MGENIKMGEDAVPPTGKRMKFDLKISGDVLNLQ